MPDFPELIVILVILVIIFGAKTIPQMGESLGRLLARRAGDPPRKDPPTPTASSSDEPPQN